jgi:hypothetical protein
MFLYIVLPHDDLQTRLKHVAVIHNKALLCSMGETGNISSSNEVEQGRPE